MLNLENLNNYNGGVTIITKFYMDHLVCVRVRNLQVLYYDLLYENK
jgi:hypothetical protein